MTEIDVSQMTPEQRLKQIKILLSTAAKTINRTDEQVKEQEERIARLEQSGIDFNLRLNQIAEIVLDTTRLMAQQQANIEIMQAESRRSQAEIERIWQYLMSRSGNGNSPQ